MANVSLLVVGNESCDHKPGCRFLSPPESPVHRLPVTSEQSKATKPGQTQGNDESTPPGQATLHPEGGAREGQLEKTNISGIVFGDENRTTVAHNEKRIARSRGHIGVASALCKSKPQDDLQYFQKAIFVTSFSPPAIGVTVGDTLEAGTPHYGTFTRCRQCAVFHLGDFRRPTTRDRTEKATVMILMNDILLDPDIPCRVHVCTFPVYGELAECVDSGSVKVSLSHTMEARHPEDGWGALSKLLSHWTACPWHGAIWVGAHWVRHGRRHPWVEGDWR